MTINIYERREAFTVPDVEDGSKGVVEVVQIGNSSPEVLITMPGYGDCYSMPNCGFPVAIEFRSGVPWLLVWSDIHREEPTHEICLGGAAEKLRKEE